MFEIIESKNGVEAYPEGVVEDKNNDTVGKIVVSVSNSKVNIFRPHGVTMSSAARKGSRIHSNGALFLSGGKPIYQNQNWTKHIKLKSKSPTSSKASLRYYHHQI